MNTDILRKERIENMIDATSFREPKKIPVGAEILSWPFAYAGVKYADVIDDPSKTAETYVRFLNDIDFDFMWGASVTMPVRAFEALGCFNYAIADDGVMIQHRQALAEFMSAEEYPELIADPAAFDLKFMKRIYKNLNLPREEAYESVKKALVELKKWSAANKLIEKYVYEDKGIIPLSGAPIMFLSPLSNIFDKYRGMRDTLLDLRRRPDVLRQACAALLEGTKRVLSMFDPKDFTAPYPFAATVYHVECFLSPAQFDEFFFDPFMELCLPFMEAGLKFFVKGEGHFLSTIDRYRKLPKGSCVFMLDEDDPFEVHKAIGDWQVLATGITADLLQLGTKQQCIDYVKKSFDTFAPGGGFIFMQNKPLLCANDAKTENLIAVYETAHELSRQ